MNFHTHGQSSQNNTKFQFNLNDPHTLWLVRFSMEHLVSYQGKATLNRMVRRNRIFLEEQWFTTSNDNAGNG